MAKGKYADMYWFVRKEKRGYVWSIKGVWDGDIVQSSLENEDDGDKYLETETAAVSDAIHAIQDHY